MVAKRGKPAEHVKSYRPISLLPISSKVLELLFLNRLAPIIEERRLIPDHNLDFEKDMVQLSKFTGLLIVSIRP